MVAEGENNIGRDVIEELVEGIGNLQITHRRSWPPTQQHSARTNNIKLANGASENAVKAIADIVNENLDRRLNAYIADKRKSDAQRSTERRAYRRQEAYRTEMCKRFIKTGECPYGDQCRFAHHQSELRVRPMHPNYKTKLCRNFARDGFCYYGHHCQFLHLSPPNTPLHQQRPRPLALSAIQFSHQNEMGGGGMNDHQNGIPLFVPQHPMSISLQPQYGSTFAAPFMVTSPTFLDANGYGIPTTSMFFTSTPVNGNGDHIHFQFPPPPV